MSAHAHQQVHHLPCVGAFPKVEFMHPLVIALPHSSMAVA